MSPSRWARAPAALGRRNLYLDPLRGSTGGPALVAFGLHLDRGARPQVGQRARQIWLLKLAPVQPDLRPLSDPDVQGARGAGDRAGLLLGVDRLKLTDDGVLPRQPRRLPDRNVLLGHHLRGRRRRAAPQERAIPTSATTSFRTVISPPVASLTRRGTLSLSSALVWPPPCISDRRSGSGRPCPPGVVLPGGERQLRREGRRP